MFFGPRRADKTEAMLNRVLCKITECCSPGTRADICIVCRCEEQAMSNLRPRLEAKLLERAITLEPYKRVFGGHSFIARIKTDEAHPCVKIIFMSSEGCKQFKESSAFSRDGVLRDYFFDHTVLEQDRTGQLDQWLKDLYASGFKIVPISKEAETAMQFAAREAEVFFAESTKKISDGFKQEYSADFSSPAPDSAWQFPPWDKSEDQKKDTDENNDPS
jgi:hypothetical protein